MSVRNAPIGMFDSGLGGLSVMHAVRDALPGEDILYYGDCLYAPYGDRNAEYIKERCLAIGLFLISKGAKAIVVSCNTATAEGVNTMRETLDIPIIGIEPAIKPAAAATQTGVVGVIATTRTITSERYLRLVREFAGTKIKVVSVPCPGLMECVESGEWDSFRTQKLIEKYLHPIKRAGADKLVLGCTHYPFLSSALKRELGGGTELIDPSAAVARELKHQLLKRDLLSDCAKGREVFYISGDAEKHRAVIERLWSSEEALDLRSDPPAADPTLS